MIFVINSWGSKKKQQAKNQNTTSSPSSIEGEEEAEFDAMDLTWDEVFDSLRKQKEQATKTWEGSFKELRKNNEQATKPPAREEDDYIPRSTRAQQPIAQPVAQIKREEPRPITLSSTLRAEGGTPIKHPPIEPIESGEIGDLDETFNLDEIDWRQTVVASEILNRRYT